jgi:hypothetical protein
MSLFSCGNPADTIINLTDAISILMTAKRNSRYSSSNSQPTSTLYHSAIVSSTHGPCALN